MTLLATVVETWQRVAQTSSRSAKIRELAACVGQLAAEEIDIGVLYLSGEIPQGKMGLGYATLARVADGSVATASSLTLAEIDGQLTELAALRGAGSAARRGDALQELFARATAHEQQFLMRLLLGELRQGALAGIMLEAIATAAQLPLDPVRRAAMYGEHLGAIARLALTKGEAGLQQFQLVTLSPIAPMLAQSASDVTAALEQLGGEAAFEWKIDGARVQVHKLGDQVRIYTRGSNEVTAALPEIAHAVRVLPAHELVLDGEAIALDASGRARPFQVTMRRFGRKLNVAQLQAELPMQAFFFDCLRSDNESLIDRPARDRFAALARALPGSLRIPQLITRDVAAAQAFYDAALAQGHEGVMAKALDAPYEAGNRGASWLKIKRTHSLDLVVLAAEWGSGRRRGRLSNLHLGARDAHSGEFVMLGKTFKGLTDALLDWQTQEFLARETHRDAMTVYVKPELVVEIAFNDIQASPQYPGGLALRFARVKGYRSDKRAEEADTIETVQALYEAQSGALDHALQS